MNTLGTTATDDPARGPRPIEVALLASVFVVAACGLLYELAAGALASYVLGDSVLQFSTIIGTYLFAMGVGSWLSRYFERQLPAHFLRIELLVALVGGRCRPRCFWPTPMCRGPSGCCCTAWCWLVGTLVGLEIPLVMRILKRNVVLKDLVSQVLTFDYLGALAVSLAFPLLLVPQLGLIRTGLLFGLMNAAVALWALWLFRWPRAAPPGRAHVAGLLAMVVGGCCWRHGGRRPDHHAGRRQVLPGPHRVSTHLALPAHRGHQGLAGHRLFLNGNLQFAERDEYRYHEALVHPAMAAHGAPARWRCWAAATAWRCANAQVPHGRVGHAGRAGPRHDRTAFATTPCWPGSTAMALRAAGAHRQRRRLGWLQQGDGHVRCDRGGLSPTRPTLPSASSTPTASTPCWTSAWPPAATPWCRPPRRWWRAQSFWTVVHTIESVGLRTTPYHAHVPSFGEWGFIIASRRPWRLPEALPDGLKFLTRTLPLLLDFPLDMARVPTEVNRLSNQVLVHTFEREWGKH
jgi:spermidine synthase